MLSISGYEITSNSGWIPLTQNIFILTSDHITFNRALRWYKINLFYFFLRLEELIEMTWIIMFHIHSLLLTLQIFSASVVAKLPNIVFILSDDVGWNDFSIHGSEQCLTPYIDELAQESVILDNYYTRSVCSPTRASLLTGRHVTRTIFKWTTKELTSK